MSSAVRIYLDHNATAPLHPAAAATLGAHLASGQPANPSSIHWAGRQARRTLGDSREHLAHLLGCTARALVFTASGTEANALALRGSVAAAPPRRRRLLVSAIEHSSVLKTADALAWERGDLVIERLPVTADGRLDVGAAGARLSDDVLLVSLMLANNETGVLQPVRELALLARAHGIAVHCDVTQVLGRLPFALADTGADLVSAGAHKFGGGLGTGFLVVTDGAPLSPLLPGHQENGRRGGTENVASIAAATAALAAIVPSLTETAARTAALRDHLERGLLAKIPGTTVNGAGATRLPNTTSLSFAGADGEAVLIALDVAGIAASSGAACASGTIEPSHVLLAMGQTRRAAGHAVRFSLGSSNTTADIEAVLAVMPDLVEAVRRSAAPPGAAATSE